jgi:hypothetical protein
MPNQKTLMVIAVTAILTLVLAGRLRQLPLISKIPTV